MPVFLWPWPNFRKVGVKMFYIFFFLPVLSTSRLSICHSCIHLQAITDAVMFVRTGIVLAAFSTIIDTVRLVRTGIVLAAFSTVTDIVTVRLVRTGTVLAAFSTITVSGLLEQGLCWLHSVQLQTLSGLSEQGLCWLHSVQLQTLSGLSEQGLCWLHSVQLQTLSLSGLSEQGLCWLHSVQLHCQACQNRDCAGCIQYSYRHCHCQACQNRDCVGCIQYNYTVRLVRTGTVLAAFSTITLSGLSEQGLCWLHSVQLHCQACQNRDCVGCMQYNYTVRLVRTGIVLAACSTITLSGLSEQGLCWLHAVQLHCQACWNKDCVGCMQYNYTVRFVGTGTVLAAFRQHGAARVCILLLLFTFFCYCLCVYIFII